MESILSLKTIKGKMLLSHRKQMLSLSLLSAALVSWPVSKADVPLVLKARHVTDHVILKHFVSDEVHSLCQVYLRGQSVEQGEALVRTMPAACHA